MENTLENKYKFFALYWGLEFTGSDYYDEYMPDTWSEFPKYVEKQYLILKPLSSISEEDAKDLAKTCLILAGEYDDTVSDYELINYCHTEYIQPAEYLRFTPQYALDFLRSRGYALPWSFLSVEELVNRDWVKMKGETSNG